MIIVFYSTQIITRFMTVGRRTRLIEFVFLLDFSIGWNVAGNSAIRYASPFATGQSLGKSGLLIVQIYRDLLALFSAEESNYRCTRHQIGTTRSAVVKHLWTDVKFFSLPPSSLPPSENVTREGSRSCKIRRSFFFSLS